MNNEKKVYTIEKDRNHDQYILWQVSYGNHSVGFYPYFTAKLKKECVDFAKSNNIKISKKIKIFG